MVELHTIVSMDHIYDEKQALLQLSYITFCMGIIIHHAIYFIDHGTLRVFQLSCVFHQVLFDKDWPELSLVVSHFLDGLFNRMSYV